MVAQLVLSDAGLSHVALQNARSIGIAPADVIHIGAHHMMDMDKFDYSDPAEVFACRSRGASPRPVAYKRFASGAEAIRFAVEELPAEVLFGTVLEVNGQRFDAAEIRRLYENGDYPLQRRATA